jgi:beta-lactamase regulating signal transducer with metallopeptidase domain
MMQGLGHLLRTAEGTFALHLLLKATLLLALAGGAGLALRRASAASRHLVWTLAVAGLLALPLFSLLLPAWRVPLEVELVPTVESPLPLVEEPPAAPVSAFQAPALPAAGAEDAPPAVSAAPGHEDAPFAWGRWLFAAWALGAALLLLRLVAGWWGVRRLAARAEPVTDAAWARLLKDLSWMLDVDRPLTLLRSPEASMPMTWGTRRPVVLLPAEADGWSPGRRRVVLLHELAHVARRDCLTQMLADVACALYWVHPLAWHAARRLRVERERACDDRVLGVGARASEYAGHLLEVARAFRPAGVLSAAAIAMARPSQLEGRLLAVLDSARSRRVPGRRALTLGAAATALLLLPLSALEVGEAREAEAPPTLSAVRAAAPRAAAAPSPAQERADFHWQGRLAPGQTLQVRGVNGAVRARPASGDVAEVRAVKRAGRRGDPEDVQIRAVEHGGGVVICALYPSRDGRPSECRPEGSAVNTQGNDTEVEFTVSVPAGVRLAGGTVNGAVSAESLRGDVDVHTVNGEVRISTSGTAAARTVNGAIQAAMGSASWPGELEFQTVNGAITVTLPANASGEVRVKTLNGSISSDFPMEVARERFVGKRARGTLGSGGGELSLQTLNGAIRLLRAGGPSASAAPRRAPAAARSAEPEVEIVVDDDRDDDRDEAPRARRRGSRGRWALDPRNAADRALLEDPDPEVRRIAVWSLGRSRGAEAVAALGRSLRGDASAQVREMAAWSLGNSEDPAGIPALRDALARDASEEVRYSALLSLGDIDRKEIAPALVVALEDRSTRIRKRAAWNFGAVEPRSAPPRLVAALRDEDAGVRRAAAWSLGQIEDPSAVEALTAALQDPVREVRKTALWALSQLPEEAAQPAIVAAVRSGDAELRKWALDVMSGSPWPMPWPWPTPRPRPML